MTRWLAIVVVVCVAMEVVLVVVVVAVVRYSNPFVFAAVLVLLFCCFVVADRIEYGVCQTIVSVEQPREGRVCVYINKSVCVLATTRAFRRPPPAFKNPQQGGCFQLVRRAISERYR